MTTSAESPRWRDLLAEVPREPFIPDDIWVYDGARLLPLTRQDEPQRWHEAVMANQFVVTQVNLGDMAPGEAHLWPSSSCSMPAVVADMLAALDVRQGQSVLEIGTGTGWNAALLCRRVGVGGQVVTVEVDPGVADAARTALCHTGYHPEVVTADGLHGCPVHAPYDRVISTAAVREAVPQAWLEQLRGGGRLVTPWDTDWHGALLTLQVGESGDATGRFHSDLAFMRIRSQRAELYCWQPDEAAIRQAHCSTTECRGTDLDRMLNPDKGRFAIGARVRDCHPYMDWDAAGTQHHYLDLDDGFTGSFARLDANLNDPAAFTVRQLGPRSLWDDVEAAYDWWHEHGEPRLDRFGLEVRDGRQWIWLDEPTHVVRMLAEHQRAQGLRATAP